MRAGFNTTHTDSLTVILSVLAKDLAPKFDARSFAEYGSG